MKVTKNGKLVARKPGQDHFNAKESRSSQLGKKRTQHFELTNKAKSRYLVHSK